MTKDIDFPKYGCQPSTSQILHPLLALAMHAELPGGTFNVDLSLHDPLLNLFQHGLAVDEGRSSLATC